MIFNIFNDCGSQPRFNPKQLKYDAHGVPVLSIPEIEQVATEFLGWYCPDVLKKPSITPVLDIIQKLKERTKLNFKFQELGYKGKAKILGKVNFDRRTLYLDPILAGQLKAALRFTAAHEIGHWILHRYNYKNWNFMTTVDLQDDEMSLQNLDKKKPADWLEFQANVFAASIVMPRETFVPALKQAQESIGITKNIGIIYLTNADYSRRDYNATVAEISQMFCASKQSVRVRIKALQLFHNQDQFYEINRFTTLTPR